MSRALQRRLRLLMVVALPLLLSACSTLGSVAQVLASATANAFSSEPRPAYLDWQGLMIAADADANLDSPVALDIVFVRDNTTLEKVQVLPAIKWFADRAELQRTFADALIVRSVEMVPRQVMRLSEQDLGSPRVAGVLLFADYATPGEHRIRLTSLREGVLVRLGARTFTVAEHKL